jgi:hypothetical protein
MQRRSATHTFKILLPPIAPQFIIDGERVPLAAALQVRIVVMLCMLCRLRIGIDQSQVAASVLRKARFARVQFFRGWFSILQFGNLTMSSTTQAPTDPSGPGGGGGGFGCLFPPCFPTPPPTTPCLPPFCGWTFPLFSTVRPTTTTTTTTKTTTDRQITGGKIETVTRGPLGTLPPLSLGTGTVPRLTISLPAKQTETGISASVTGTGGADATTGPLSATPTTITDLLNGPSAATSIQHSLVMVMAVAFVMAIQIFH